MKKLKHPCQDCGTKVKHLNVINTVDTAQSVWQIIVCDRCKKERDRTQRIDDKGWYHDDSSSNICI